MLIAKTLSANINLRKNWKTTKLIIIIYLWVLTWNWVHFTIDQFQSKTFIETCLEKLIRSQQKAMQNLNMRGTQKALNELKNLVLRIRLTYFTTKRAQCWWRRKLKNLLTTKLQKINNAYLHYLVQGAAIVPAKGKTEVCSLPMKIKFIETYPIYNRGVIWSLNNTLEFSFFALFQNFISYPWFKP